MRNREQPNGETRPSLGIRDDLWPHANKSPGDPILQIALALAAGGCAIFPVNQNKSPRCLRGHLAATSNPDEIKGLHARFRFLLIGVATGTLSGLAVLDIDRPAGLPWWRENRHRLPATRTHRTRGGGLHLWFRHRPGLRSSVARIAPGIDVRADGGAAIWWPAAGLPVLADATPVDWPDWLLPPPKPTSPPRLGSPDGTPAYASRFAAAALRRAADRVRSAGPGTRNHTLNAEAFSLARFVSAGELAATEIARELAAAAALAGLEGPEILATIRSGMRAGGVS